MDANIEWALKKERVVDITTTGRKSGKPRRIEIWFYYEGQDTGYLSGSPGRRDWVANLLANPRFTLHVKRGVQVDLAAEAETITDEDERRKVMTRLFGESDRALEERIGGAPLVRVQLKSEHQ